MLATPSGSFAEIFKRTEVEPVKASPLLIETVPTGPTALRPEASMIVTVLPATVNVPVREAPVLAVAEKVTVLFPVPEVLVRLAKEALLDAVQLQALLAVMEMLPVPPL